jgi:hypothetical protein
MGARIPPLVSRFPSATINESCCVTPRNLPLSIKQRNEDNGSAHRQCRQSARIVGAFFAGVSVNAAVHNRRRQIAQRGVVLVLSASILGLVLTERFAPRPARRNAGHGMSVTKSGNRFPA